MIKSTRTFSDEGFIESIDFTAGEKSVSTKKYYKTTTKEELEADRYKDSFKRDLKCRENKGLVFDL